MTHMLPNLGEVDALIFFVAEALVLIGKKRANKAKDTFTPGKLCACQIISRSKFNQDVAREVISSFFFLISLKQAHCLLYLS